MMENSEMGYSDGGLGERIYHRLMSEGPQYVEVGGGRRRVRAKSGGHASIGGTSTGHSSRIIPFLETQAVRRGARGNNSENQQPGRNRSAGHLTKQQMASDCGLKSLPQGKRDVSGRSPSRMSQGEIYLNPPDFAANVRRGMSGSKVRPGSVASIARGQASTPRASVTSDWFDQESIRGLSPRPYRQNVRTSASFADEGSGDNTLTTHYKWNNSEQGQRLQRQLTRLSSSRSMKRSSEMMKHRLDPMYLMSGSKVGLGKKYDIEDSDVRKLKEMTQMREDLIEDLNKMKYPYAVRSSTQIIKLKPSNHSISQTKPSPDGDRTALPPPLPTPASEQVTSRLPDRPSSEHSDSQVSNELE